MLVGSVLLGSMLLGLGCAASAPYVWSSQLPPDARAARPEEALLRSGDTIAVVVEAHEALSANPVVTSDGFVVLPLVGAISVAGRSPDAVKREVTVALTRSIEAPKVSVVIVARRLEISVLGEVEQPGKFQVDSKDGIPDALALAGGLSEFADDSAIYVVRASYPKRIRFRLRDLVRGGASASSFDLRDGDLVIVE